MNGRAPRILVFAGLLGALLGATGPDPVISAPTPAPNWIAAQDEARASLDYERVLDVVREHRAGASDRWTETLAAAIVEEARAEQVHPLLVAAIVARESSFDSRIVSHAGAVGLMQLRPWVAEDLALRNDMEWQGLATLHTPRLNVRLGVRYYKELLGRFGEAQAALTAYCYGPSRVARQLQAGTFDGSRYASEILALYGQLLEQAG